VGVNICLNTGVHDGSITIVEDGKILVHLLEERFTHVKHNSPPIVALTKVKEYVDKVDKVSYTHLFPEYADFTPYMRYFMFLSDYVSDEVNNNPIIHYNHHDLHAICGFSHSGFEDAVVVVIDGAGSTHYYGKENQTIYEVNKLGVLVREKVIVGNGYSVEDGIRNNICVASKSIHNPAFDEKVHIPDYVRKYTNIGAGYVYSTVTELCGFGPLDCGKTMGLSAYGEDDDNIPKFINETTCGNDTFTLAVNPRSNWMGFVAAKLKKEHTTYLDKNVDNKDVIIRNLAYRVQKDYEEYLISTCKRALELSKSKNLVLTGGCALNCVANYKLLKSLPDDINLYVEPVSDDSGVGIGGALVVSRMGAPCKLENLYLGTKLSYSYTLQDDESEEDTNPKDVAELISKGNIVAIAQGKSEIGPRALGNRSILFDPRVKDGKDIVNKVKRREYFRPFAGTVLLEHAREWFDMDRLEESPYMMYAVDVLPEKKDLIPSIVHVDGTCRIQTVTKEQNEHYYNLISEFYKLTGVPILFNTSFNLAGDTIVETIDDAFFTIRNSDINYMYTPEVGKLISVPNNAGVKRKSRFVKGVV
tara:strand:- start:1143 stop:2903 length:1761 start_codon:yes stop_codon:yes gene_type:complete